MTEPDWADELTTKLLDNTPELKQVSLREIMAMALRDERSRCAGICGIVLSDKLTIDRNPRNVVREILGAIEKGTAA